jgi:hypothetical protein
MCATSVSAGGARDADNADADADADEEAADAAASKAEVVGEDDAGRNPLRASGPHWVAFSTMSNSSSSTPNDGL